MSWDRLRRDHPGLRAQLLTLTFVAIAVVALDGVVGDAASYRVDVS